MARHAHRSRRNPAHRSASRRRRNPGHALARRSAIPVVHYAANAPARRHAGRRGHHMRSNPRRARGFRRNPVGLAGFLGERLKGGALVYGGRIVNKKLGALVQGFLPAPTGTSATMMAGVELVASHALAATAVALAGRSLFPRFAVELANGAFAEAIEQAALLTPAAPYLSAYVRPAQLVAREPAALRAYARPSRPVGLRAYARPSMGQPSMAG